MFKKCLRRGKHIIKQGLIRIGKNEIVEDFIRHHVAKSHTATMTPVERHIYLNTVYGNTTFGSNYLEWTMKRINKVIELYGLDFFYNKRILELGGGAGDIGAFFAEIGAEVLSIDARINNVVLAQLSHRKLKNFKCRHFNLENDFSEFGNFDLIINFGLIYLLKNVEKHLNCCAKMSDEILLECNVSDSADPSKIIYVNHPAGISQPVDGVGSRCSPYCIERIFKENNFDVIRCFSKDLNAEPYIYDWEHKNDNSIDGSKRRFWNFKRSR